MAPEASDGESVLFILVCRGHRGHADGRIPRKSEIGGPSAFWALVADGSNSFMIATNGSGTQAKYDTVSGDFEGLCQADYGDKLVYVMVEGADQIGEYDVSTYGSAMLNRQRDVSAHVPTSSGSGSEGITFVPNEWLIRQHFVDGNANPYLSTNGMAGLMFVAHQNGGRMYAFDLNRTSGAFHFVGAYRTSQSESSGLEFDRSTGLLYIWHNTYPNYLEVTELASYRDGAALMWFKQFNHTNDLDGDRMADAWELSYLASTTNPDGSADNDHDNFCDLNEYLAGTVPTNPASLLAFTSIADLSNSTVVLEWLSASNRFYDIMSSTNMAVGLDEVVAGRISTSACSPARRMQAFIREGSRC